jgi:hypothetical protein
MTTNTPKGAAEARIYELAAQHGIVAERVPLDDWADKVTELSGDDVVHDPVEDLVITLQRKGVITDQEASDLFGGYLREGEAAKVISSHAVEPDQESRPVRERLAKTLAMSRELGPYGPGDHKRETDEMWGEE